MNIVLTESQLSELTKYLITEQTVNLGGLSVSLNQDEKSSDFGSLKFIFNGKEIKIRLFTTRFGNVNIVDIKPNKNGVSIKTKKGVEKDLKQDMVNNLVNYVKNDTKNDIKLDSSFVVGDLMAKKL
jgi:hypothetical protein